MTTQLAGRAGRRARLFRNSSGPGGSLDRIVHPLVDGGAFTPRQTRAAARMYDLLNSSGDSSAGIVAAYSGRTSTGTGGDNRAVVSTNAHMELQHVLDGLREHERRLLNWIMRFGERPHGKRAMHYYCSEELGLDLPRTSASQIATGLLQALFESVAERIDGYSGHSHASRRASPRREVSQ